MLFDIDDKKEEDSSNSLFRHRVVIKTEPPNYDYGGPCESTKMISLTWLDGVLDECLGQHEVGSDYKTSSLVYIKPERIDGLEYGDGGGGGIKIEEEENIRRLNLRITQCSKRGCLSNILVILDDEDSNGLLSDLTEESANNHMDCDLIDYDKSNLDAWRTVNDEDLSLILQSNTEATCAKRVLRGKAHLILFKINNINL